jgi:hypothetical protein
MRADHSAHDTSHVSELKFVDEVEDFISKAWQDI